MYILVGPLLKKSLKFRCIAILNLFSNTRDGVFVVENDAEIMVFL
jgi:hypothetical protein